MNLSTRLRGVSRLIHYLWLRCRRHLPRQRCLSFAPRSLTRQAGIGPIFVINLDRKPERWTDVLHELSCITDSEGEPLSERAIRYSATDALSNTLQALHCDNIEPDYTLADQLFVEPQPHALPDVFELERPIRMSPAEVAVAYSHIGVWKAVAQSNAAYALVLEDDVWFERGFGRIVDQAWAEMEESDQSNVSFDLLYLSYKEVRYGAPKQLISKNVFRPERGLWYLSGYVLSKKGAQKLLGLLPCRGPIDLWINHKFRDMDVLALRRSVINQRLDTFSTNSYSILPALNRIGVLNCDAALFHQRPVFSPVFAFGDPGTGLSSLAMALSMLGYRCCSDINQIPECEFEKLIAGSEHRVFDAYVNVGSLRAHIGLLMQRYPRAKYIVIENIKGTLDPNRDGMLHALDGVNVLRLNGEVAHTWGPLCDYLRLPPPVAKYPAILDIEQRTLRQAAADMPSFHSATHLRHDRSPWAVEPNAGWTGIDMTVSECPGPLAARTRFEDDFTDIKSERWLLRSDTFPGNLGLFRPANVASQEDGGLSLSVIHEPNGVRDFSAAAISSRESFMYGRFETTLRAANVPGLVTGFFLHRDSPRQEIDIEITGNHPSRLLVNVFYNPGAEGAKFDYGYRGTPTAIPLAFDASKDLHLFAIEWDPCEIRWFVDGRLVYRRVEWNPTPIPHLPMTLHLNTWPSQSRELAGRLAPRALPASTIVRSIAVDALNAGPCGYNFKDKHMIGETAYF